jgi:hypothetical protein
MRFQATGSAVWTAVVDSVHRFGWEVDVSLPEARTLKFTARIKLDILHCNVGLIESPTGETSLGVQTNSIGIFDGGKGKRVIQMLSEAVSEALVKAPSHTTGAEGAHTPTLTEEIERLAALYQSGAMSDVEFQAAKDRLIGGHE